MRGHLSVVCALFVHATVANMCPTKLTVHIRVHIIYILLLCLRTWSMNRMWRSVTVFVVYTYDWYLHMLSHIKIRHCLEIALRMRFPGHTSFTYNMYDMIPIGICCLIGKSKSYGQIHCGIVVCDHAALYNSIHAGWLLHVQSQHTTYTTTIPHNPYFYVILCASGGALCVWPRRSCVSFHCIAY